MFDKQMFFLHGCELSHCSMRRGKRVNQSDSLFIELEFVFVKNVIKIQFASGSIRII